MSLDISEDVDTQENNQTTSLTRPTPSHRMAANSTNDQLLHYCSNYTIGTKISTASIALRTIVTLPLGSLVLYLGHQRWRQQHSFKTTSHSDVFTYNTAVLNLIWGLGCICYVCGTYGQQLHTVDMAANSSTTVNSSNHLLYDCYNSSVSIYLSVTISAVRTIVTLPLGSLVLYLGHQRWRQQRSFKTTRHSDVFTYNMAVLNLIWGLACVCIISGMYGNLPKMIDAGIYTSSFAVCGEAFFHVLTCVERYLAVVHPITYMGLRNERGVRIRNISIACVWLMSFVMAGATALYLPQYPVIPLIIVLVFSLAVVSFCSLSVLCVLIRPGPGEGGGEKQRVDRSKQRAFQTIAAILGVLGLWFVGLLASTGLYNSHLLSTSVRCVLAACSGCFNLPCSLMLPLLYLHRAGKLSLFCNHE
ncbi:hypothetical protein ABVT39_020561 [Epinephelus coioides]